MKDLTSHFANKEHESVIEMWQNKQQKIETPPVYNPALLFILNQSPCVTWILDVRTQKYDFISSNTLSVFGYDPALYLLKGLNFHESTKYPEDYRNTWKLMHQVWNTLEATPAENRRNYQFSYDYRVICANGKCTRIMEQNSILHQDLNGNITHLLGICTNISEWKKNDSQIAFLHSNILGDNYEFTIQEISNEKPILSKRQQEIIKLMSEGYSSKFIAEKLCISFHTVNTHRQNMMEKTNTKNTGELIQFAFCNALI